MKNYSTINQHEIVPAKTDIGALANRINKETRTLHDKVDKMVTLKFAIAVRDAKIYRQGIQFFYHVFSAIEDAMEIQLNTPSKYQEMFQAVYKPEMLRREKLYSDLSFFYGDDSKFSQPIMPQQIEFADHIRKTIANHPYLLLAYMHVMYLALFAGGRIMSSQVAKSLGLFPHVEGKSYEDVIAEGTNFYHFDVEDMEVLRIVYKRDYELATRNFLTEEEKQEIISESKYIFEQVAEGISEIERHNIQRITKSLGYQVITKGYYVLMALLVLLVCYICKRLVELVL